MKTTEAREVIAEAVIQTLRAERWFVTDGGDGDNVLYHKVAHVLAAEIDRALGGLSRQWTMRYEGGGIDSGTTYLPIPGFPSDDVVKRSQNLEGRKIVIGWASGWSAIGESCDSGTSQ